MLLLLLLLSRRVPRKELDLGPGEVFELYIFTLYETNESFLLIGF